MWNKKKNRNIIYYGFIMFVLTMSACFYVIQFFKDDTDDMLINISELSEEFMDNYFEEYNALETEEKENIVIVISSEKINNEDYGASEVVEGPNNKYYLVFEDDATRENAISQLNEEEFVHSVEENIKRNFFVDNEASYNSWGIKEIGLDKAISMVPSVDDNEVVVAILDTGLDVNLFNKYYFERIKTTHNVLPDDEDTSMYDNYGHGTHIAGTIAEGTPTNVKILPVKISDSASIYETDILAGLEYITYYTDVDVINMSFGGMVYSEAEYQAIEAARQKNIIAVAAAGNDNTSAPSYPAAFDNTISISSIDDNLVKSDFSNYGPSITFASPGGKINSLMASYMVLSSNEDGDDDHEIISGTSMATPHAVSAVALLKSFNKNLSLENVINLLKNNVTDLGQYGYDYYYGHGLINFNDAIKCDDSVTTCDEFNIFKVYEPNKMSVSEVKFTNYNYGSITNLLLSTVDFLESDGYNYQKQLWQLEDLFITGYDPYSSETQTVTIKYLDFETIVDIQNPANYELGWEYTSHDGYNYLSGYKDSNSGINKLYIPNKINDVIIKGILNAEDESSNIFYNSSDATYFNEIIIPEGIEYVGDYAFSGLTNVSKVTIKNSTIDVGTSSFANMAFLNVITGSITLSENNYNVFKDDILLEEINISNSTKTIPMGAFENCKLLKSITIPASVITIDDYAFKNSGLNNIVFSNQLKQVGNESFKGSKLSNLTLPDSLEIIGNYAFSGNIIEAVEIPKSVNTIGLAPFSGNYINTINVNSENLYYDSRDNSNLIIETSTNKIIQGSIKSVIPDSVLIIGEASYSELNEPPGSGMLIEKSRLFTSLEIPNGVTTIEKDAFLSSHYLEKVILPRSVTSIDSSLFKEHASGFGRTALWIYKDSYAYDFAINNDCTYVDIENSSVAEITDGFQAYFDDREYYPYETIDVQGISYYYWDYSVEKVKYVDIPNYTISYQNGDSLRYGDDKFYFNFSIENGHQNVKLPYNIVVKRDNSKIDLPTINLLIGEPFYEYCDSVGCFRSYSYEGFEESGDYTIEGYYIYNDTSEVVANVFIPVHVMNKRFVRNEVNINTKISDGTTYIDPDAVTLVGLDKNNYTVVSAYLNSADYIGNEAEATVKIRLNDDFYENYAFTGDQQELEWITKMTVVDIGFSKINLLIGERIIDIASKENDFGISLENGILYFYDLHRVFDKAGDYTIKGEFISNNSDYSNLYNIDIPIHVINKQYVKNEVNISTKIADGTTYVAPDTVTLVGLDKSNYTVVSAYLNSADYIGNEAKATVKIRLNDDFYENYAFTGNKQELEWTTTMTVADIIIPDINLLIGEDFYHCDDTGCFYSHYFEPFKEAGEYVVDGVYTYNDGSKTIENLLIPVHVINKKIVYEWAEISPKEYDGTTYIDINTITLPDIDKNNYTIVSAELDSPDVSEWGMAKIKVKLNDSFYENYAFTGNKQESEWVNPIKVTKGTSKYDVPQNLKAELGQSLYDISLPKGFEWISENEVFNEAGIKTYEAKYTPEDTENYKTVENIKITINVSSKIVIITFNSNDESAITSTQELEQDKKTNLKENTFERDGFNFIGWNTKADGTGTSYSDKQEISITENLTLYAQWQANKYSVTFDANGGIFVGDKTTIVVDEWEDSKLESLEKPTRQGYTFKGYYTEKTGGTSIESYIAEAGIDQDGLVFYAQWIEKYSYIINKYSYDDNKKFIDKIDINTTVDDFKKNIDLNIGYSIDVNYKTIGGKNLLYTGSKTKIYNNNNLIIEYTNIIRGDVSGDGKINYLDYVNVYNHIQKVKHLESDKKELKNEYLISADMSGEGKISYLDYVQIYNKIKELKGGN